MASTVWSQLPVDFLLSPCRKQSSGPIDASEPAAPPTPSLDAAQSSSAAALAKAPPGTPASALWGTTMPFTPLESAVARFMEGSLQVPTLCVSMSIETGKLEEVCKQLKKHGVTMTVLLAKAVGIALVSHPVLCGVCTPDGNGISYTKGIDVAVVVATAHGGLTTPVLKDADKTNIFKLSSTWVDLVKRARAGELQPDECNCGAFRGITISNLGMYGVDYVVAPVPPGASSILTVGSSQPTQVADKDGTVGIRKAMKVNMTADHRVVYGADAAQFLLTLKAVIENPERLMNSTMSSL